MIVSARLRVTFDVAGERVVHPTSLFTAVPYAKTEPLSEPSSAQQILGGEAAAQPEIAVAQFDLNYGEVVVTRRRLSVRFAVRAKSRAAARITFDVLTPGTRFRRRGVQAITAVPVPGAIPPGRWAYSVVAGTSRIAAGVFDVGPAMGVELRWPTLGFALFTVYASLDGGPETAVGYPTEGVFRHES